MRPCPSVIGLVAAVAGAPAEIAVPLLDSAVRAAVVESSRSVVIALLEEALAELGAGETGDGSPARWLLSASLARELADGPHCDLPRAVGLASSAVDGARAADDASRRPAVHAAGPPASR